MIDENDINDENKPIEDISQMVNNIFYLFSYLRKFFFSRWMRWLMKEKRQLNRNQIERKFVLRILLELFIYI